MVLTRQSRLDMPVELPDDFWICTCSSNCICHNYGSGGRGFETGCYNQCDCGCEEKDITCNCYAHEYEEDFPSGNQPDELSIFLTNEVSFDYVQLIVNRK